MSTFKDLGLNPMIMQALEEIGFETPTSIQNKTIPHLINSDKDLIALAQTGTGKTAAFALPIIHNVDENHLSTQAIVLCPTRELAIQVAKDINNFAKYLPKIGVLPVFGGERIDHQIRALKNTPQIVVGTPGRVRDLINRRVLKLNTIKWLVLDEADEMLNMGFKEELDEILKSIPKSKQTLLFSATMDSSIRKIADNYMKRPEELTVGEKNKGTENVQHFYYIVHEKDRYQALKRITDMHPDIRGIIFCRTRRETQQIADKLIQDHYSAEAIHGEISQSQRTQVMDRFREEKTQLLVATDVAARGIDVQGLTHIINYNLPESTEAYVHRSGRTGRANQSGVSLIILNMREKYKIKALEKKIGRNFEQGVIPSGSAICESQLFNLAERILKIEVNEKQIGKYLDIINKKFEHMDRDELIKRFVSVEFNRFLEYYEGSVDLNSAAEYEKRSSERASKKGLYLFARFKINVGGNEGLNIKEFFNFMNSNPKLKSVEIGNVEIKKDHSRFEVDEKYKAEVISSFMNADINGKQIKITCEQTGIKTTRKSKTGEKKSPASHNRRYSNKRRNRKKRY